MIQTFPFYAIAINMDIRYVELIYTHTQHVIRLNIEYIKKRYPTIYRYVAQDGPIVVMEEGDVVPLKELID